MFGKKRKTIYVDEVLSIGAVSANEGEPEIVFWKKKPDDDQGALWTNRSPLITDMVPTPSIVQPAIAQIRTITETAEAREARLTRLEKSLMPKEPVETVAEFIEKKMSEWAEHRYWSLYGRENRGIRPADIRADYWTSHSQANDLAKLLREQGDQPMNAISKSGEFAKGWKALDSLPE